MRPFNYFLGGVWPCIIAARNVEPLPTPAPTGFVDRREVSRTLPSVSGSVGSNGVVAIFPGVSGSVGLAGAAGTMPGVSGSIGLGQMAGTLPGISGSIGPNGICGSIAYIGSGCILQPTDGSDQVAPSGIPKTVVRETTTNGQPVETYNILGVPNASTTTVAVISVTSTISGSSSKISSAAQTANAAKGNPRERRLSMAAFGIVGFALAA